MAAYIGWPANICIPHFRSEESHERNKILKLPEIDIQSNLAPGAESYPKQALKATIEDSFQNCYSSTHLTTSTLV